MTTHLEASVQHDLEEIRTKVVEMGELAEHALRSAIRALAERNRQLAFAVILRDQYIDEAEKQLDRLCLEFLVRHQPAATLLRFAYASIKVNLELERIGDYAESIGRQALKLAQLDIPLPLDRIQQIADLAVAMLRDAVRAFVEQDPELARRTAEQDEAVDMLRRQLVTELTQSFRDGTLPFEAHNPLVMVASRLERASDQARNICMETLYLCTGEIAKHPGSDVFRVLFIDEHNACRSLMAELIGTSLGEPGFVFSSAGVVPEPVQPATIRYMASRGFDVARAVPKALSQVANLEHEDVLVVLAPEAKRVFPRRPRHTVLLDWSVADPSKVQGSEAKVSAAYEATYSFIEAQIRDLVSAIRDTNRT